MFTEILKIIPRLSSGDAAKMEKSLSSRFTRVASRFGAGLKNVIKGSFFGISVAFLAKLLNPIQAIEEKINKLFDRGEDLITMADELGATSEDVARLQVIAAANGVKPEQIKEMVTKFNQFANEAEEGKRNNQALSAGALAVSQFSGEKNRVNAFLQFMQDLGKFAKQANPELEKFVKQNEAALSIIADKKLTGKALTSDEISLLNQRRKLSVTGGMEAAREAQTAVFGSPLYGAARKLSETSIAQSEKLAGKLPTGINQASEKVANLSTIQGLMRIKNDLNDFVNAANKTTESTVKGLEELRMRDEKRITDQLDKSQRLISIANDIKKLTALIESFQLPAIEFTSKVIKNFESYARVFDEISSGRFWNFLKGRLWK